MTRLKYLNEVKIHKELTKNYYMKGGNIPVEKRKKFLSPLLHYEIDNILQYHRQK